MSAKTLKKKVVRTATFKGTTNYESKKKTENRQVS